MESTTHAAIDILDDMGPLTKSAVPALIAIHARENGWAREMVHRVINKIDPVATKKLGLQ